ncbi:hypothetical protein, partial [Thiolapillus sp.]|uniref:hypothetical protein n=1 Tax=Thiolapillus sp. TaxID=2017437 RepID=UPI003AF4B26F
SRFRYAQLQAVERARSGQRVPPVLLAHPPLSGQVPLAHQQQACLRPRDRFWDIPAPKIDSAFDNLLVPQPSWSPSTTQQLRKLVAAPYLAPNDWTPRLDAYFASPLALCARRVSSAASRLLGSTSLRFALHGWQRMLSGLR